MIVLALILATAMATSLVLDSHVRPRAGGSRIARSLPGAVIHLLVLTAIFGLFSVFTGNSHASAVVPAVIFAALVIGSNAKYAVLGEPLLFSDLALAGAVVRHPQFYLSALKPRQFALLAGGLLALVALLAVTFRPGLAPRLVGLTVLVAASATLFLLLRLPPWRTLPLTPDTHTDVERHGLLATLVLHARQWRQSVDLPVFGQPIAATGDAELVIVLQCESFADPVELFGDPALALPGLTFARANACRWGRLQVSGFGAYTMRTEYGVLFGRDEASLGFRRFDPFLTAVRDKGRALPARLRPAGWRSIFAHPHDIRFYGRDRIMPAAGFDELIGEGGFEPPRPGTGRYVSDSALAERIVELAAAARQPTLIYAVTIENHGPWPPGETGEKASSPAYLRLVNNSDAMLSTLIVALGALRRPALLLFFGDHRPSIPGLSVPGGDRHTPFAMLRFGASGELVEQATQSEDLTPAELHQALVDAILTSQGIII